MNEPPTGIIRTLPLIYADPSHAACINYEGMLRRMEENPELDDCWFMALAQQPKKEVLHIYVLIGGHISDRFNLAGFRDGHECRLWDGELRHPKTWAICSAPVSRPPEPIKMRGFRGFRYTQDLW